MAGYKRDNDCQLTLTLDVITQDLAVALGTTLSKALASLSAS
jgi:hypothetical protein